MIKRVILPTMVAVIASFSLIAPTTGFAAGGLNVRIDGYLPAPPGVTIHLDAGRPYYIEKNRRVYVEKKQKHDKGKHRGRKNGHGKN